jgi:hypothetical protein
VHNVVEAELWLMDGLIAKQHETFSFWSWSSQALGAAGWLLVWSSFLQGQVQAKARKQLSDWKAERASASGAAIVTTVGCKRVRSY